MKKLLFVLFGVVVVFVWGISRQAPAGTEGLISDNEIYVFIQRGCSHCKAAEKYLKEKHPDLKLQLKDISEPGNLKLFFACGAKFKLNKVTMGTPLFCMGKNYILGWSFAEQQKFETYVQDFLQKETVAE